jgi:hypothetical protein
MNENLGPVSVRIGNAVRDFIEAKLDSGSRIFYADDLRQYVSRQVGLIAPGSADRILRDLRQRGVVDYVVLNRARSEYEAFPVTSSATA